MPNSVSSSRLSLEDNINSLLEELVLADKWQRPSLLLAVHKSKFGQDRAERALEEKLQTLGQHVVRITVDQEHSDVPHLVVQTPALAGAVFFISNLDWGGGPDRQDAYRALNIYRELFVDHHIRAVFWLTIHEAAALARLAPDFWAFRHRVIEFSGQRIPRLVKLPAGVLIWDVHNTVDPYDTLEARIAVREDLLGRLPHTNEARSARIDLLDHLGGLYWFAGDPAKASAQLNMGLELAKDAQAGTARSSLMNGLAIIAYEAGQYDRSVGLLQAGLHDSPENPVLLVNLAITCNALGRNQEALGLATKAARAASHDPRIWSSIGYLHIAVGKYDEAIKWFSKAAELAPRQARDHLALAICYDSVERSDEAARELDLARGLASGRERIALDLCAVALGGEGAKVVAFARAAIQEGRLTPLQLQREPNVSLLMDAAQVDAVLA
jgi:Flp pilus assembly protein TadD